MFKVIASGKLAAKPLVIIFGLLNIKLPPFLTPGAAPSKITGSVIVIGLPSITSKKSMCKILSVTG